MGSFKIIPKQFFERDVHEVGVELLGQYMCRTLSNGKCVRYVVTEVEAYDGPEDKACHASKGRTPRTQVMFAAGGVWYVYLCYGMHWMLNIVTGPKDYPAALLIRGIGEIAGPGRVTKALCIDKNMNAKSATRAEGLWFEHSGENVSPSGYEKTPRIGIDYAGPYWKSVPYRYVLKKF